MILIHLYWSHYSKKNYQGEGYGLCNFSYELMTKSSLDSVGMKNVFIFYDLYHSKLDLKKNTIQVEETKTIHWINV